MKERNSSVDIFRIIAALMVVSIHTGPLSEFGYNWWYTTAQILPRLGVPFFFCTMGYYYIGALLKGQYKCWNTMKRLLITYGLWSMIYYLQDIGQVIEGSISVSAFIVNCFKQFILYGSREHFWFFPAVFFSIVTATVFAQVKRLAWLAGGSLIAYMLGLLGCSYYGVGNRIPLVSYFINLPQYDWIRRMVLMGLPFFMMGYYLQRVELQKIRTRIYIILEIIFSIVFLTEIILVNKLQVQVNVYITIALYPLLFNTMLLLLKNSGTQYRRIAAITRDISNFMYYAHPLVILWVSDFFVKIVERNASGTELFLPTVGITILAGYLLHKLDNKYLNYLYK